MCINHKLAHLFNKMPNDCMWIIVFLLLHIWRNKSVTITFTNFKRNTLPSCEIESDYIMITGHPGREWSINHRTGRCFTGHVRRTDGVWDSLPPHARGCHPLRCLVISCYEAKKMCVYCHMLKKIRVGRSETIFFLNFIFYDWIDAE